MFVSCQPLSRHLLKQRNLLVLNQNRYIFNKIFGTSVSDASNPKVFMEVQGQRGESGRMVFELYANKVPKTAENFRLICAGDNSEKYTYEGSTFHRIIDGFMAQGGDFTRHNGTGGLSIYGDKFEDEPAGLSISHSKRGMLSMANAGPNTNGSQFFITFDATNWPVGNHVLFGELIEGEDVLKLLEANGSRSGKPKQLFTVTSCGEVKEEQA